MSRLFPLILRKASLMSGGRIVLRDPDAQSDVFGCGGGGWGSRAPCLGDAAVRAWLFTDEHDPTGAGMPDGEVGGGFDHMGHEGAGGFGECQCQVIGGGSLGAERLQAGGHGAWAAGGIRLAGTEGKFEEGSEAIAVSIGGRVGAGESAEAVFAEAWAAAGLTADRPAGRLARGRIVCRLLQNQTWSGAVSGGWPWGGLPIDETADRDSTRAGHDDFLSSIV